MRCRAAVVLVSSSVLSACALHPIPEDVVSLSTLQIVEHIRCEVREAIRELGYSEGKRPITNAEVDAAVVEARKLSVYNHFKDVRANALKLLHNHAYVGSRAIPAVGSSEEFKKILDLTRESEKLACDLISDPGCPKDAKKTLPLQQKLTTLARVLYKDSACISKEIDKLFKDAGFENSLYPRDKTFKPTFSNLTNARRNFSSTIACFMAKHDYYQSKSKKEERDKAKAQAIDACGEQIRCLPDLKDEATILAIVEPDKNERKRLEEALEREKEAERAKLVRNRLHPSFNNVAIGYSFDFTMTDKDSASVGLDFSMPFTKTSLSLGVALSEDKTRSNSRDFIIAEDVTNVMLDRTICGELRDANWRYPITGKIGLAETVSSYLSLGKIKGFFERRDQLSKSAGEKEFNEELEFTTQIDRGPLSSTWPFSPAKLHQFKLVKVTPKVSHTRKDVHKLTITFLKAEDKDKPVDEEFYTGRSAAVTYVLQSLTERKSQQLIGKEIGKALRPL